MMPPPNLPRLHWSPVEPSWIVGLGLVVLGVLPHQVPHHGRRVLQNPVGGLVFAALSVYVASKHPVLGAAMLIFLAGLVFDGFRRQEGFTATTLNKERVKQNNRWLGEELLSETPVGVQDNTFTSVLNYDKVSTKHRWGEEDTLDVKPEAVQTIAEVDAGDFDISRSRRH